MTENKSGVKTRQQLLEKYDRELEEFEAWIATKSNYPQNLGKIFVNFEVIEGWRWKWLLEF